MAWTRSAGQAFCLPLALCAALGTLAHAAPAAAQREIVQPLPPAEAADLNAALRRLSANPADLDALLQAGEASLALNDTAAAEGFYARALAVAPANGFARLGMARVRLDQRQPVEALQLFEEAERAGVPASAIAAHRAFAYDLVGDQARAQTAYRTALLAREDAETRRRLALSLAISGQRQAFEDTIYPLLSTNDRAAFRTRAFGLAILGEEQEAVVIAETMLPTDLALRMAPYLRYMPRLTAAQQAAAANLGVFPRAADIGRDSAEIASYAAQGQRIARSADVALTPSGQTLGQNRNPPATSAARGRQRSPGQRRRPDGAANVATPPIDTPPVDPPPVEAPARQAAASEPAAIDLFRSAPQQPSQATPPVIQPVAQTGTSVAVALPAAEPPPRDEPSAASVADAFADFDLAAAGGSARAGNAVDITAITPPREVERIEPAAPAHPARHWVQVATGRDLGALKFDWRRIARGAEGKLEGKGPFTAPWVEANRLLAGPFPSAQAAREMVNELKELGLDTFPFASDEGEEIVPLR